MRKEIELEDMEQVAGGNAYINANNMKCCFDSFDEIYQLHDCTATEAAELCNSFIGQYATVKEYDQACLDALEKKGWITLIG